MTSLRQVLCWSACSILPLPDWVQVRSVKANAYDSAYCSALADPCTAKKGIIPIAEVLKLRRFGMIRAWSSTVSAGVEAAAFH